MPPMSVVALGSDMAVIIECFIIVVIGGLGSLPGAFLGAIILGLAECLWDLHHPQTGCGFCLYADDCDFDYPPLGSDGQAGIRGSQVMKCFAAKSISPGLWLPSALIFLFILPFILPESWVSLANEMLIMALAGCALNLMLGYGGMVSFGPAGLYAVGAYTTAILLTRYGSPFALAVIAAPIVAGIAGGDRGVVLRAPQCGLFCPADSGLLSDHLDDHL